MITLIATDKDGNTDPASLRLHCNSEHFSMTKHLPHTLPRLSILLLGMIAAGCSMDHKDDTDETASGSHSASHDASATAATASTGDESSSGSSSATMATTGMAVEPPASPTDLMASPLEGGVHLVWKDVATNEDNYVLENKMVGDPEFATVSELPFDSVTYHDINVVAGMSYVYRVKAVNAGGESLSNEAMIQVP